MEVKRENPHTPVRHTAQPVKYTCRVYILCWPISARSERNIVKESVKSLRAYLIFVSVMTAWQGLSILEASKENFIVLIIAFIQFSLAAAYMYAGASLEKILATSLKPLAITLASGVALLTLFFLASLSGGISFKPTFQLIIGGLIAWYLYKNAKRLSAEIKNTAR